MSKKPLAKIDWSLVERYLEQQSPGTAIAAMLGISRECLYGRCLQDNGIPFSEYKQIHSSVGIEKLRHNLYQMAVVDKVPSVNIFLSKQLLGYTDKVEAKIQTKEWKVSFGTDSSETDSDFELDINDDLD